MWPQHSSQGDSQKHCCQVGKSKFAGSEKAHALIGSTGSPTAHVVSSSADSAALQPARGDQHSGFSRPNAKHHARISLGPLAAPPEQPKARSKTHPGSIPACSTAHVTDTSAAPLQQDDPQLLLFAGMETQTIPPDRLLLAVASSRCSPPAICQESCRGGGGGGTFNW